MALKIKNSPPNAEDVRDAVSIPGLGRSPGAQLFQMDVSVPPRSPSRGEIGRVPQTNGLGSCWECALKRSSQNQFTKSREPLAAIPSSCHGQLLYPRNRYLESTAAGWVQIKQANKNWPSGCHSKVNKKENWEVCFISEASNQGGDRVGVGKGGLLSKG